MLLNETKASDNYKIVWNAANFNSGIYFCQMNINDIEIKTIKLIYIK